MLKAQRVEAKGLIHIHKRRTERFVFDVLELRNFKLLVKNKATRTPQGVYYICPNCRYALRRMAQEGVLYIHFCVGLSALLVSTNRAMRRPQHVERAADWLHVFVFMLV